MRGLVGAPQRPGAALAVTGPRSHQTGGGRLSVGKTGHSKLLVHAAAGGKPPSADLGPPCRRAPLPQGQSPEGLSTAASQQQAANNIVPKPQLQLRTSQNEGPAVQEVVQASAAGSAQPAARDAADKASAAARAKATTQLDGAHRPVGMVVGSAWLLSAAVQLAGAAALIPHDPPLWLPWTAGGLVGGLAIVAHEVAVRRLWRAPATPQRVLITGGSSGVGKALAREFLRCGDTVVVTSRSAAGAAAAVEQLREETGAGERVSGVACDVSDPASVDAMMAAAAEYLGGRLDIVINNAGYSGSFQSLTEQTAEQVRQVVATNLAGSLLVTRAAMLLMGRQPGGGHIFNTEGAGSDGSATPQYAAYGATKCALAQLLKTLQREARALPTPVRVHNVSPGMVLTPLLLEGATQQSKQVFNILCEHPETVAAFLVPRVRSVVALGQAGRAIRFLTPTRALAKFITAPLHAGKYFDREGRPVYASERERLMSAAQAKKTARRQRAAARRSVPLQLAYSLGMAASFLLIVSDALAKAPSVGP